jgi:hypothetical protein
MAVIKPTIQLIGDGALIVWENLSVGDVGEPVNVSSYKDRDVQIIGSLFGPSSPTMQGSNDGLKWDNIGDLTTAPVPGWISISKNVIKVEPKEVRPTIVGGAVTGISFYLMCSN